MADSYLSSRGMQVATAEPNVNAHLVDDEQWGRLAISRTVSLVVAYLDLMEAGDRAANEVYAQLTNTWSRLDLDGKS